MERVLKSTDDGSSYASSTSVWGNNRYLHHNHGSFIFLTPPHNDPSRKSTLPNAIFNLIASMIGGGVLSLPLAVQKAGSRQAIFMLSLGAILTYLTLWMLCFCARKTGASAYNDVIRACFGNMAELMVTGLLFFETFFTLVAYMILIMGIWGPLLYNIFVQVGIADLQTTSDSLLFEVKVLLLVVFLISYFLVKRDLYSLRHICYIGFCSVISLCYSLAYCTLEKLSRENDLDIKSNLTAALRGNTMDKSDGLMMDLLFTIPIFTVSYFAAYNVLEIHSSLENPTGRRVKFVLGFSCSVVFILYTLFGFMGYLYAQNCTRGNILLNFDSTDSVMLIGRLGMGITITFAMPIIMVPCRESVMILLTKFRSHGRSSIIQVNNEEYYNGLGLSANNEVTPLVHSTSSRYSLVNQPDENSNADSNSKVVQTTLPTFGQERIQYYVATFLITVIAFTVAVLVPDVALVWSLIGSAMTVLLGFFFPSVCYLKLRWRAANKSMFMNCVTLILSISSLVAAVLCTYQTIWRLKHPFVVDEEICSH